MTLYNLISVINGVEGVKIYSAEPENKCIYRGLAGLIAMTNDLDNYIVVRIALDEPFLVIIVKKG